MGRNQREYVLRQQLKAIKEELGEMDDSASDIEEFREKLPRYMLRHRIPAGLTGWAQVHGLRGDTDLAERLRFDLDYLERWSLFLDVEILLRTVWHVLAGQRAG